MKNILCRLGLHKWVMRLEEWDTTKTRVSERYMPICRCERCGVPRTPIPKSLIFGGKQ